MRAAHKVANSMALVKGWFAENATALRSTRAKGRENMNKDLMLTWLKGATEGEVAVAKRAHYFSQNTSTSVLLRNWIRGYSVAHASTAGMAMTKAATTAARSSSFSNNGATMAYSWLVSEGLSRIITNSQTGAVSRHAISRTNLAYAWLIENGVLRCVKRAAQLAITCSAALVLTASAVSPAVKTTVVRRSSKSMKLV
jgi:hypothetical protein